MRRLRRCFAWGCPIADRILTCEGKYWVGFYGLLLGNTAIGWIRRTTKDTLSSEWTRP